MKTASLPLRLACLLLLALAFFGPGAQTASAAAPAMSSRGADGPATLQANKLFDYIRGNRSRMVQVTTVGLGLGLLILMTATRKN